MLGDGAAALHDAPGLKIGEGGAGDAQHVDAEMLEEAPILGRDDGLHQVGRHILDADGFTAPFAEARDLAAVAIDDQHDRLAGCGQCAIDRRQVPGQERDGGAAEHDHPQRKRQAPHRRDS